MRTGAMRNLVSLPFNYLSKTGTVKQPNTLKMRGYDDLLKIAGRFGARRHTQYEKRFLKPKKRTPFQS